MVQPSSPSPSNQPLGNVQKSESASTQALKLKEKTETLIKNCDETMSSIARYKAGKKTAVLGTLALPFVSYLYAAFAVIIYAGLALAKSIKLTELAMLSKRIDIELKKDFPDDVKGPLEEKQKQIIKVINDALGGKHIGRSVDDIYKQAEKLIKEEDAELLAQQPRKEVRKQNLQAYDQRAADAGISKPKIALVQEVIAELEKDEQMKT